MKINKNMRAIIFEVLKNQIDANDPPEIKITYNRLIGLGYTEMETNQLLGQCLTIEIFGTLKHQQPFNNNRYIKNLKQLPKEPVE